MREVYGGGGGGGGHLAQVDEGEVAEVVAGDGALDGGDAEAEGCCCAAAHRERAMHGGVGMVGHVAELGA